MKITIDQMEKLGACQGGLEWLRTQKNTELSALVKAAISEKTFKTAGGEEQNTLDYANWAIARILSPRQRTLYACFAARCTLRNYTDKYPTDSRVLGAIYSAEKWANDPSDENRVVAWSEASSAAEYRTKAKILRYGVKLLSEKAAQ